MSTDPHNDLVLQLVREREARLCAEAETRSRDDFLALVAHELRTPLSAILGWTQIIAGGGLDTADFARAVAAIERSAIAQERIIADLYDAASIKHGKFSLSKDLMPLQPIVAGAVETMLPAAHHKSICLEYFGCKEELIIECDAGRLQQVVRNLLANAFKFTPIEGSVRVCCEREGSTAQINISDSGCGIEPEFLNVIFDRHRQGGTVKEGLGLGLWIANHIINNHQGSICAASWGKDQGATFTVRLPLVQKEIERIEML